jgi:PP-loop superfamily ATP-utilizing enzyme
VTCARCLYVEGMGLDFLPSVVPRRFLKNMRIEDDGVCSLCHAYERAFDAQALARERDELVEMTQRGPIVVALSGGKDSLSTLWLTRNVGAPQLSVAGTEACPTQEATPGATPGATQGAARGEGLALPADRVRAVLLDNGFIPPAVLDVARAACARLDVALDIVGLDDDARTAFAASVAADDASTELPCSACSRHLERALLASAHRVQASALVTGTNFFASWGARPSSFTSTRGGLTEAGKLPVVHLPYMLGVTRRDVERNLDALGVRPVQGLAGSSNCRVPGLLQARAAARGHSIDVEDKLLEVLVGHLERAQALV